MERNGRRTSRAAPGSVQVLPPSGDARARRWAATPPGEPPQMPRSKVAIIVTVAIALAVAGYTYFAVGTTSDPADDADPIASNPAMVEDIPSTTTVPPADAPGVVQLAEPRSAWGLRDTVFGGGSVHDLAWTDDAYDDGAPTRYVAVGERNGSAAAWSSFFPLTMIDATIELPAETPSAMHATVRLSDGWLSIGEAGDEIVSWTSWTGSAWTYTGPVPALAAVESVVAMEASGDRVILVGESPDGIAVFASTDGADWEQRDPGLDPAQVQITEILGHDDRFLAAGSACTEEGCRPAVWSTTDGNAWDAAPGITTIVAGESADEEGRVTSLAASSGLVVAAGWTGDGARFEPAVWLSADGASWRRVRHSDAFDTPGVGIVLNAIEEGPPATANLTIGGSRVTLTERSRVTTAIGELEVLDVSADTVTLVVTDRALVLRPGDATRVSMSRQIEDVSVREDRVLAVGHETTQGGDLTGALAWTSTDAGSTWQPVTLPGDGRVPPRYALLHLKRLIALSDGTTDDAWDSTWDIEPDIARAEAALHTFVGGAMHGDADAVTRSVGGVVSADASPPSPALPGAEAFSAVLWTAEGTLDTAAVIALGDAFTELGVRVLVGECGGSMTWEPESVHLTCSYLTESDVLTGLGLGAAEGVIRATARKGMIEELRVEGRALAAWRGLEEFVRSQDPATAASTFGVSSSPADSAPLTSVGATEVLGWTERYVESVLLPGESKTTEGPWGTIEWRFTEPRNDVLFGSITPVSDGFIARVEHLVPELEPVSHVATWVSTDGVEWTEAAPGAPGGWGDPIRVGSRLLTVSVSGEGRLLAWAWDGAAWVPVEVVEPDAGRWWWREAAASGDRVLLIAQEEGTFGQASTAFWSGTIESGFEQVVPDGLDLGEAEPVRLIGRSDGFVLMTRVEDRNEVWVSDDGVGWRLLSADAGFGDGWVIEAYDVGGVLNVIVEEDAECSATEGGVCRSRTSLWWSRDGADWRRAVDDPGNIRRIAVGEFGAIAVGWTEVWTDGMDDLPPMMSLYLGTGDGRWSAVEGLLVGASPDDNWRWLGGAAVGEDGIVLSMRSGSWSAGQSSLLVGRLAEGG